MKLATDIYIAHLKENVKNEEIDGDVLIKVLELITGLTLINAMVLHNLDISEKILERYKPNE